MTGWWRFPVSVRRIIGARNIGGIETGCSEVCAKLPPDCTGHLVVERAAEQEGVAFALHVSLHHDGPSCPVHEHPLAAEGYAAYLSGKDEL